MVPVLVGGAGSKRGAGGEAMNKKDIYFSVLGKCLTVIMRLLWSRLIRSNRQGVIVVSLVSLRWQLLYKVSALQSRKWGCFRTQWRAKAAASYQGGIPPSLLRLEQRCCRVPRLPCTALSYVSWLVSHLQADSSSQGTVPHQSFETRAVASPAVDAR